MTATVTKLHTTPNLATLDQDALMAIVQRDAAMRAVYRVIDLLEATSKRAKTEWKEKKTEATKAYREHLRDEDRAALGEMIAKLKSGGRMTERERERLIGVAEHHLAACKGLAKHDEIRDDGKADKDARKKQIAKAEAAHRELAMQGRDGGSAQVALFEPEAKGAALAMTDETKEHVYAALLQLDKDGGLDDVQKLLLAELGEAGIKALDLGINAAAAVEQTVADEPDDDEDEDEDGEGSEIPF